MGTYLDFSELMELKNIAPFLEERYEVEGSTVWKGDWKYEICLAIKICEPQVAVV